MREKGYRPVALIIVDGWGTSEVVPGNALRCVPTPSLDWLQEFFPTASLCSFGEAVGLMSGQMGDSNVGHLNLGAGRIVYQDLVRVKYELKHGALQDSPAWLALLERLRLSGGRLHLFGLLSNGGVHSHIDHLKSLLLTCREAGVLPFLHAQLDGRDVPPDSGAVFIKDISEFMELERVGKLVSVMGRYYGMDRDRRWERTERAYRAMVLGEAEIVIDAEQAVLKSYEEGVTDEFVLPFVIADGQPNGRIRSGDEILFFNFRADRARQIVQSFWSLGETGFAREELPLVGITTLTQYHREFPFAFIFPPQNLVNTLGEVVSHAGLTQLRLAETEKYAHVTYFFNGGADAPFPGEERILIPSPQVATYDLRPEMSAAEVTEVFLSSLDKDYALLVVNYANLDMVGHTGVFEAACRAVEVVDEMVGRAVRGIIDHGGVAIVTSDHGNAEKMFDESGGIYTAHTLNPVACIIASSDKELEIRTEGILADVAPTILELMGIVQPAEMSGRSLIRRRRVN